jgi:serine/threonine protein kinase
MYVCVHDADGVVTDFLILCIYTGLPAIVCDQTNNNQSIRDPFLRLWLLPIYLPHFDALSHDIGALAVERKYDLTPEVLNESLEVIPGEEVYPEAPSHITTMSKPMDSKVFFKGPMLTGCIPFKGMGLLLKLLLQEAEILELLMSHPHPNIVRYHSCLIKCSHVIGLILDQYALTLKQWLQSDVRDFNIEVCMSSIMAAVNHLHSLGLVHNDLMPMNIMVDEQDTAIVIDLGSCQPFGRPLITAGTPGWTEEDYTVSAQHHDEIALGKIRTWLEEQWSNSLKRAGV